VNVEEIAKEKQLISGFEGLTLRYIDVPILDQQEQYFGYTDALMTYANYEGRLRMRKLETPLFEKPAQVSRPPLYLLLD
jgi:hypothetical protein